LRGRRYSVATTPDDRWAIAFFSRLALYTVMTNEPHTTGGEDTPANPPNAADADGAFQRFVLDISHPNCWTLAVTEQVDAGLLGHGVYDVGGQSVGRFTAYAESNPVSTASSPPRRRHR